MLFAVMCCMVFGVRCPLLLFVVLMYVIVNGVLIVVT